jgi:hypothetical protein
MGEPGQGADTVADSSADAVVRKGLELAAEGGIVLVGGFHQADAAESDELFDLRSARQSPRHLAGDGIDQVQVLGDEIISSGHERPPRRWPTGCVATTFTLDNCLPSWRLSLLT